MKYFILLSCLTLFSCAKENVFPKVKSAGEQVASKSALWWDASAQKKDPYFLNGIRDLSNNDRNCLSNTYPLLDTLPENEIAILRFEYRHLEIDFRDRQRIWLNGDELSLGAISDPAEGVILEDLSQVKIQSQTAAEIASLLFFDKRLSDQEVTDVECELGKKYKISSLDC